jgi:hypothetical protein
LRQEIPADECLPHQFVRVFLLCFKESEIFEDEKGLRSRPEDLHHTGDLCDCVQLADAGFDQVFGVFEVSFYFRKLQGFLVWIQIY